MSDRLFVATRKGLFTFERSNGRWSFARSAFLGEPATMVLPDANGRAWVALKHGHFGAKIHRTLDGGATWGEVASPAFPKVESTADEKKAPSLFQIWSLERGGGADELWAGAIPAGLFHSTDGGATWSLVESLWNREERKGWFGGGYDDAGIHSICIDPRNAATIRLGISCGGVWQTNDAGKSWGLRSHGMWAAYMPPEKKNEPNIQDPHRMAQSPSAPDVLWTQHHNAVFRSTDGSKSWHEIPNASPSVFGFAVAVHPKNADRAWFVPAVKDECRIPVDGKLVVSRTSDGGKTFEVLRRGLPQEHSYDLVYRHGLDVDRTGDRLAIGSTTGGLWISENGGDDWSGVNLHLPPIYAVRFG